MVQAWAKLRLNTASVSRLCQDCFAQSHSPIYTLFIHLSIHSSNNNGTLTKFPREQWSSGRKQISYTDKSANAIIEWTIFCGHPEEGESFFCCFYSVPDKLLAATEVDEEIKCHTAVCVSPGRIEFLIPALSRTGCMILGKGFSRFSALSIKYAKNATSPINWCKA